MKRGQNPRVQKKAADTGDESRHDLVKLRGRPHVPLIRHIYRPLVHFQRSLVFCLRILTVHRGKENLLQKHIPHVIIQKIFRTVNIPIHRLQNEKTSRRKTKCFCDLRQICALHEEIYGRLWQVNLEQRKKDTRDDRDQGKDQNPPVIIPAFLRQIYYIFIQMIIPPFLHDNPPSHSPFHPGRTSSPSFRPYRDYSIAYMIPKTKKRTQTARLTARMVGISLHIKTCDNQLPPPDSHVRIDGNMR